MYTAAKKHAPGTTGSRTRRATWLAPRQRRPSTTSTPMVITRTATNRAEYQTSPTPRRMSSPTVSVVQSWQVAVPAIGRQAAAIT